MRVLRWPVVMDMSVYGKPVDDYRQVDEALLSQLSRVERFRSIPERALLCTCRCNRQWYRFLEVSTWTSMSAVGGSEYLIRQASGGD